MAPLHGRQRTWAECDFTWANPPAPFTWDDVYFIIHTVIGNKKEEWDKWQKKEPEKKQKLIKLICTINGERFEESKYVKDVNIEIEDMQLILHKLKEVKINVIEVELLSESMKKAYSKILDGEK